MVKLSDMRRALGPGNSASDLTAQMQNLQNKIKAATEPSAAFRDALSALPSTHVTDIISSYLNNGPGADALSRIDDQLIKSAQARAQRERENHDNAVKQTILLQQSQELQQQFVTIMSDQARLMEGMLSEAKNNTLFVKLAVYFAALSAAIGLIALIVK